MNGPETTAVRARRLEHVAVKTGIALAVLVVLAISINVGAFVMVSPMMG
ncbi:hypothetical protein [Mycobacterium paraffinicum]|nr:hypothetical protein [Mycobacterium paraffinicum]